MNCQGLLAFFLGRLLVFLLISIASFAQFTTVTGTVTDPNGLPYALGTLTPTIEIPSGAGSPRFGATPYIPPSQATGLDANGSFTVTLADNNVLQPAGTRWGFQVCSGQGSVPPAGGFGPVCFTVSGVLITGASQSISAMLSASAVALSRTTSGSGGIGGGPLTPNSYPKATGPSTIQDGILSDDGAGNLTVNLPFTPGAGGFDVEANGSSFAVFVQNHTDALAWVVNIDYDNTADVSHIGGGEFTSIYRGLNGHTTDIAEGWFFAGDTGSRPNPPLRAETVHIQGPYGLGTLSNFALTSDNYATTETCASSTVPANCANAPAGSVAVPTGSVALVVDTTAVNATSQIMLTWDSSLGTALSVTCNTNITPATVSARTAGTSFTITLSAAPAINPACVSYTILN